MKRIIGIIIIVCILIAGFTSINAQESKVAQLKEKIIDLQNEGKLGFKNFFLCTNIIGYGQYVAANTNKVKAGTEIYFYYEPQNLFTNRSNSGYHVWYTQDMIVLDAKGKEIYNGPEMLNFNYQTTAPVLDYYATNSLSLGNLPTGKYTFKAVMHDKLKNAEAVYTYDFEIVE